MVAAPPRAGARVCQMDSFELPKGKGFENMKALLVMVGLGGVLVAGTVNAQTAGQKPAAPPPAAPAAPAAAPQPPRPFPEGAKVAFVDVQAVASNSTEG